MTTGQKITKTGVPLLERGKQSMSVNETQGWKTLPVPFVSFRE